MTNLNRLTVSLTKHGAHKIATLLKLYPANEVMKHLEGSVEGVNIERAQAQKNLSANSAGVTPAFWEEARSRGDRVIDSLVLLAIIFSHNKLISAMTASSTGGLAGRIERNVHLREKEFTNFSHILDQLGYATTFTKEYVDYDLESLFKVQGLGDLAKALIREKLSSADWDATNSVENEAVRLGFHEALSLSEEQFVGWLNSGHFSGSSPDTLTDEDQQFFTSTSEGDFVKPFEFSAGHTERSEGTIEISSPTSKATANLLHNKIQNRMYLHLCEVYGEEKVGTETDTGFKTSIDVVLEHMEGLWFYEIKTAASVKASIRQAIPQLLEYAYWPDSCRAEKLIIVSQLPITENAKKYLQELRGRFGLPIYYQQFDLKSNALTEEF
ncbi:hypothetical protein [Stenotrophomonas sp.]|uniref:hypothetical protein n=1 Tax=Stenotrophomonas sp. TaxID=69392 RepID=UPI0025CD1FE2|nr:hypothetical protein [Stenotrophomonas sp.]MBW8374227.1 hypothetical protein [Stenotrophomonas sp.]